MKSKLSSLSSLPADQHLALKGKDGQSPPAGQERRLKIWRMVRKNLSGYLFLLPALLIFALFVWYPIVLGFVISFQNIDMIIPPVWVGWQNYQRIFADPTLGIAWRNTGEFTFYGIVFGYLTPLILALLMNEIRHGKSFFRIAFYLPVILPATVAAYLWRWIYDPQGGLLDGLFNLLHLPTVIWLDTSTTVIPALTVIATWANAGGTALIYLAALQGVPASLYEAAELDGANLRQRLWHITLPTIRPIMVLMLILQIIGTMQMFTEPFAITGGGPANASLTVVMLIYNYAFGQGEFGQASALGILLFLVLAVFTIVYMRMTRRFTEGD
jgi:multiple sugar transport system permease protein